LRLLPITALIGIFVIGCAEEEAGPQFASDPMPSRTPTSSLPPATPPATFAPATPIPVATPASFAALVPARGATDRVFVVSERAVWLVSSHGDGERIVSLEDNEAILAADPAPTADRVVLLVQDESNTARPIEMQIVDTEGEVIARGTLPLVSATPGAGDVAGSAIVDWSPQGNRILAKIGASSLFVTGAGSEITLEPVDLNATTVVNPAWSPTGESIAFLSPAGSSDSRGLFVYDLSDESLNETVRPVEDRYIVEFAWLPDGISLAFTEGGELAGAVSGIDLWRVRADGEDRRLVASAGTVAPVARIARISPSPDGRSIAYAVLIPGSGRPTVDSVWVRDIASGVGFRVPLPPVQTIEQIDWTTDGLVISAVTRGSTQDRAPVLALLDVSPTMDVSILWVAQVSEATPVSGTPVAATPAAQA
jgi:dipeptidyl aminopeptidase/acylaminoacyl peptidase